MKSDLWQNSLCWGGLLHDYRQKDENEVGIVEICSKCKNKKFFKYDEPNRTYLSYHIRQALQKEDPRFYKEYNK